MTDVKQGTFKKKLLAIAVLAPAMAMTACSNSSSSSPDEASGEPTGESSGVAYDGYLRGANVCVDVNLNKACDDGEPNTTTIEGGVYLLTGLSASQQMYPLALQAIKDVTVDEDTGEAITEGFTYVAPAGAKTVSGFSTIIQVETERLIAVGATPAAAQTQAKKDLATALGAPEGTDLANYDAVAKSSANDSESNFATQLRIVNQVITKQMAAAVASAPEGDASAVLSAAINKVTEKVATTKQLVDQKLAGEGVTGPDITGDMITKIADETVAEPTAIPEVVSIEDVNDAAAAIQKAQQEIVEAIEEELQEEQPEPDAPATGATGGTGSTGGVN